MKLDKDAIKESLTDDDINIVLSDLGSDNPNYDRNDNPIYRTVCHNGDSHKLYYYSETKMFHCYTGCGSLDIYELVINAKEHQGEIVSFPNSVRFVAEKTGKRITSNSYSFKNNEKIDDWEFINKLTQRKKEVEINLPVYKEFVLDVFMGYQGNWLNEGIGYETTKKFEIGYYMKENQITFANRDIEGNLIGIRSRNLDEHKVNGGMKYLPTKVGGITYRFPSAYNIYGLNHTKEAIKRLKKCMIFEGEKSVLKAEELYGEDNFTVAVLGSNISNWHRDTILELDVEEVFIAFDKHREQASKKEIEIYKKKLLRLAMKFSPYVRTYILYDDFDLLEGDSSPIDEGQDNFEMLMKKKYEIHTEEVEEME